MFQYFLYLKNCRSKSVRFKTLGIRSGVFQNQSSVASVHPILAFDRTITNCLRNPRYFQWLLKKLKARDYGLLSRHFSTSYSFFKEQKPPEKPDPNDPNDPNDPKNQSENNKNRVIAYIILITAVYLLLFPRLSEERMISWEEFKYELLAKGEVEKISVNLSAETVRIQLHRGAIFKNRQVEYPVYLLKMPQVTKFEEKLRETENQLGISPTDGVPVEYDSQSAHNWLTALIILLMLAPFFTSRNYKLPVLTDFLNISKAKFTLVDPLSGQGKGVKFSDVAGLKEAKIEIMEFVDYLKRPERYTNLGAKVPKGALLLGPPGCGKTLLAKAVATEANVPFLSMNGSEFIEMIGGLGAARVRDLFKEAKKRIPCIVYIDEIDAIGKKRGSGQMTSGSEEGEQTLNQLLVEMDGMVSNEGVVLLASTNRAEVLDKALLRPGRFDRHILIDLPTFDERKQIFEQHLKVIHLEHEPSFYSRRLAYLTPGFTGADIANVCNEAALHAARIDKRLVQGDDLEYAVERVVGGTEKRSSAISPEEKEMLAYHEAGRALTGWLSENGEHLLKVTIVSTTHSPAGRTQFSQGDKFLYTKNELLGKMSMGLAGGIAVSLIFNKVTTRAESDLKKVTKLAYAQIRKFGMNNTVGLISFGEMGNEEEHLKKPYSKALAAIFDEEARKLVASVYKETESILVNNKDKLILLAQELLKNETLNYDDIVKLWGPPPYKKKLIEPLEFELSLSQAAGPTSLPSEQPTEKREHETS